MCIIRAAFVFFGGGECFRRVWNSNYADVHVNVEIKLYQHVDLKKKKTSWPRPIIASHNKAVLEPCVSPAFAITYFCNHCNIRFENTSKYVDTLTLFSKNLNQRSLTPRWPLTPCLLRSHVWLYPRIIVSKSHDNTSMYVDTEINFAKYHIHTAYYTHTTYILLTYYVRTTYRMSDHIVSYWTQFRRDKNLDVHTKELFRQKYLAKFYYGYKLY